MDLRLFYSNKPTQKSVVIGYADVSSLSDPQKAYLLIGYVFTYNNISILWRSTSKLL